MAGAQFDQTYTIHAPLAKVWQAFTDVTAMDHWNTGPAQMDPREGGEFQLYEGEIHGITTKMVPNAELQQEWYGPVNPGQKYNVTFTFAADGDSTTVRVVHAADDADLQALGDCWQDYYVHPIKQLLEKQVIDRIRLRLKEKVNIVGNAWSFRFEPSAPLHWTAGQYIWVELPHDNPDAEGTRRWFTISAAPYEGVVEITTRITPTTFKQALNNLPAGGELELLEKPDGDFVWQETDLPRVFVAGGIGITAFHSILKQRVHEQKPIPVTLFYGNRDEQIPFKAELEAWAAEHPEFHVQYLTGMPLTADAVAELQPDINTSLVYISGPEAMVKALGDQLIANGLPQAQLRLDALPQYTQRTY
ncbi:MAG TPA: SRPBCC domain-containing protein [Candidatus Saccharimonadales bacterium]|nr:SRPBCC domain-containing protein [Candidatus Saccharimonadales bacterium]